MEDWVILIFAGILVLLQLFACIFAKKAWQRWLPFMVSMVLEMLCVMMYLRSNQTNWAYIILGVLLDIVLLLQSVILLINRLIRWTIKR